MTGQLTFRTAVRTHPGLVRSHNEDSAISRPDIGLWAVADGMGGMTAGDVASQAVVRGLGAVTAQDDGAAFVADIRERMAAVNAELRALAAQRGARTAIGSTVAGLLVFSNYFCCFWAGDSRVYRWRDGELDRLTKDHSLVQEMMDSGLLTPEAAEKHPHASVINRAVGAEDTLELEFTHARVQPGDIFLLCSDGLTRMVSDAEMEQAIGAGPLEDTVDTLLTLVLQRGAKDNVTLIMVACQANGSSA